MRIPTKISPSPIVEAVVDVRFDPTPPPDAVFGLIYSKLPEKYRHVEKLPVLQVPDEIRQSDPNLVFQPYYRMKHDSFILQVGPRIFSLSTQGYPGWSAFSTEITSILSRIVEIAFFKEILRVGLRYINFFEENVFKFSRLSLTMVDKPLVDGNILVRTEFPDGEFLTRLHVANQANLVIGGAARSGSVIDLDTFTVNPFLEKRPSECLKLMLDSEHSILKRSFFDLLQEDFLRSLNPEYD
jgi:uncharacterized protein (TIGR04255 family)